MTPETTHRCQYVRSRLLLGYGLDSIITMIGLDAVEDAIRVWAGAPRPYRPAVCGKQLDLPLPDLTSGPIGPRLETKIQAGARVRVNNHPLERPYAGLVGTFRGFTTTHGYAKVELDDCPQTHGGPTLLHPEALEVVA
jgi:hypothetical protein